MTDTQGRAKLLEGKFLTLLRGRRELETKISKNFVLHRRLATNEIFDGLGERDLLDLLLKLLGNDGVENINGLDRDVVNGSSAASRRGSGGCGGASDGAGAVAGRGAVSEM